MTSLAIPDQGQVTYVYDRAHWNSPAGKLLPGGSREDYTYDPLMRIKSIIAKDPGQNSLMTRDYTYSAAGNISAKNTEHGNYQYQYDELQRLSGAINPLGSDEAYSFDPLGNRLTAAGVPGTWSYNANNELEGYDNVAFSYDDNGNTTRKSIGTQESNYIYDVEDRLVRAEDGLGAEIAIYYYDPFGRRLYKEVDGIRTYFVYSNEGLIGEYDETGAEIKTYGWVPDSQWSTDPLFYKQQGQYYWYQNDHLGTPQKIIETNGRVVWSAVYDSFGNVQIQTAEIVNNLRFAGQYFDEETGLYYNLNRYYDPASGRYLRTDPFGEGMNLYSYVFNNPLNYIDPLGLCAARDWGYSAGNYLLDLVSPTEAYGAEIIPGRDIGLREGQEHIGYVGSRETGRVRITVRYKQLAFSETISKVISLIGTLFGADATVPFGFYERKIYVEKEVADYHIDELWDMRSLTQVSEARQKIHNTARWIPDNDGNPRYTDRMQGPGSSRHDFQFTTYEEIVEQDIETVRQSTVPGVVYRPVGYS